MVIRGTAVVSIKVTFASWWKTRRVPKTVTFLSTTLYTRKQKLWKDAFHQHVLEYLGKESSMLCSILEQKVHQKKSQMSSLSSRKCLESQSPVIRNLASNRPVIWANLPSLHITPMFRGPNIGISGPLDCSRSRVGQ